MMHKELVKYVKWIAVIYTIFISYESFCSNRYENNIFKVILTSRSDSIMHIDIIAKDSGRLFSYDAELVKICDEVPERSLSQDLGVQDWEVYYLSDSTYIVDTDSLYLGFAKEQANNYRLDYPLTLNLSRESIRCIEQMKMALNIHIQNRMISSASQLAKKNVNINS